MRIAQLAPLWETIPPKAYGGTELIVHLLTEELVQAGHQVTLFAAATSRTSAHLQPCAPFPLREVARQMPLTDVTDLPFTYPGCTLSMYYELPVLEKLMAMAGAFDIIHSHMGYVPLPFASGLDAPLVTTLHGAFREHSHLAMVEKQFFRQYAHLPYVAISQAQQQSFPDLNYVDTIHHGLDLLAYEANWHLEDTRGYLAFLGRFSPDKGAHHAVHIAHQTGFPLILAGKLDCPEEHDFFRQAILPHLDGEQICYVGELNHAQKVDLLRHAIATLCPVTWPEPFGLVLIESMACGTPVLALSNGSIPEIIRHGETGFIAATPDELATYVHAIHQLDRQACRSHVAVHFSSQRMAMDYQALYQRLVEVYPQKQYPLTPLMQQPASSKTTLSNGYSHVLAY
jgi:glycosyltransferase involved in cell wall biosynthesis